MYRVAVSMLGSKEDIEDSIQNSIIKAYEGIIKLKKNEYFKTWLIRILINECKRILKANKKVIHTEDINSDIPVVQDFSNIEITQSVNLLQEELRVVTILFCHLFDI
jgi:RNA polymerase sigma-70 factor (ECF subfamily)